MLLEAEKQHNLPATIGIDQLPRPGRIYTRPSGDNGSVGTEGHCANLFGVDYEPTEPIRTPNGSKTSEEQDSDTSDAEEPAAAASKPGSLIEEKGLTSRRAWSSRCSKGPGNKQEATEKTER